MSDEAMDVNSLPPIDPQRLTDQLRNIFYPTAIFAAVAAIWGIGWATSVEAKANVGYWSATNIRTASQRVDPNAPPGDSSRDEVTVLDN